jgi:hypothetical protein
VSGAMMPEEPFPPLPDGIVSAEQAHGRYRITVRHSETLADFLWLSKNEARDLIMLLGEEMAR